MLLVLAVLVSGLAMSGCGDDDDDDGAPSADDDADDDIGDDDTGDDDTGDDDDDAVEPDDYLAPWPQDAVETQDYDETSAAGPLRVKAETYDTWNEANAQPFYGGQMNVKFHTAATPPEILDVILIGEQAALD